MNKDRIGIALIGCGRYTLYACGKDKGEVIAIEPRTEPTTMQQAITSFENSRLEETPSFYHPYFPECNMAEKVESITHALQNFERAITTLALQDFERVITYHAMPKLCPIIDSYFLSSEKMPGMGHSSLDGRYYEKKVAKRRKKNRNKKTHRK